MNLLRSKFTLPLFTNYSDYDFRNDQALDMLEELFWEQGFSVYNFYDYVTVSKIHGAQTPSLPKEVALYNTSYKDSLGSDSNTVNGNSKNSVNSYSTGTQTEDYLQNPNQMILANFSYLPLFADLNEIEDTFNQKKNLSYLSTLNSNPVVSLTSNNFGARSSVSVFNTFRSDFSDFA